MKTIRRILTVGVVVTMLCGLMLMTSAAPAIAHVHALSCIEERSCYNSYNGTTHPYNIVYVDASGNVSYRTESCQTVVYQFRDVYKCGCGYTEYLNYTTDSWHVNCGAGWDSN